METEETIIILKRKTATMEFFIYNTDLPTIKWDEMMKRMIGLLEEKLEDGVVS